MMEKEMRNAAVQKTQELLAAPSCCAEAKAAAQAWLAALDTEGEATAAKQYIAELEEDIVPIDALIGMAGSEAGVRYFGAETARRILDHAREQKAAGAAYCDCPACSAAAAVLEMKDAIL